MATAERTPYAEAARELLRKRCSTAPATSCERRSWAEITMGDIAAAAGVSRQTLYKEFGSREAFAQAFVMREVDRFLAAVEVGRARTPRRSGHGALGRVRRVPHRRRRGPTRPHAARAARAPTACWR